MKKLGMIKEVYADYRILLENEEKPFTPTETAKGYIHKDLVGKEVDLTIENDKIIFIKILGNGQEQSKNVDTNKLLETLNHINWNMGSISKYIKLILLNQLETVKHQQGLTKIQQAILNELENGLEKDLKQLKQIKDEQENASKTNN